jgi:hypothetical protein
LWLPINVALCQTFGALILIAGIRLNSLCSSSSSLSIADFVRLISCRPTRTHRHDPRGHLVSSAAAQMARKAATGGGGRENAMMTAHLFLRPREHVGTIVAAENHGARGQGLSLRHFDERAHHAGVL